jgi:hypothetical protein
MNQQIKIPGILIIIMFSLISWIGCDKNTIENTSPPPPPIVDTTKGADVTSVLVTGGNNGVFTFAVGIFSPDIDCSQYANWWEVVSEDGELIGRRILVHSHVPPAFPQPFVRNKTITIDSTTVVWIRGHMNNTSYKNGKAFKGSIATGFVETTIPDDFALDLDNEVPDCAF